MDGTSLAEAVETLLRACSRGGDRADVSRLLLLQQSAAGRVSDVDEAVEEVEGASVVDEVFSFGGAHGAAPPRPAAPPPCSIGAKELWEAFPSWCRDTALQRRRGGEDSLHRRSFVCGAWNVGTVAGELRSQSACVLTAVYRSPWSRRYQLPFGTVEDAGDASSDNNTRRTRGVHSLEEEAGAVEEAHNEGRLRGAVDYGNQGTIITEFEQRLNERLAKYGAQYFGAPGDTTCDDTESPLSCPWATSAFVRILSSSAEEVTLEVMVLTCVDVAEEQPMRAAASLFDGSEVVSKDGWLSWPAMSASGHSKRRRWSAGHAFQLRVGPTELRLRHDSAHLIANCKYTCDRGVGDAATAYNRMWLFHKTHGRPETLPVPRKRCRNHDLGAALARGSATGHFLLETLDLDAVVCRVCTGVEMSDNAVVPLAVTPVVRVTLPLLAPSPGRVWGPALQERSAVVAAAGIGVAAMVCSEGARS
ncbi:uncharacterized protein Tco025E_00946 [Trypanosoma conorhini]|uniref:Uncharacterized protein n=1 Tax=Trypanosoma conorhini TaxID=83891 RepID=A0A422QA78_9TRYP|nr:uncharacterized protein Tco025E_00946 [Trypanosoma conorhini]RNF26864.1 hypothetical protein Tco025E_00946 [Trypanosoma conorhini]